MLGWFESLNRIVFGTLLMFGYGLYIFIGAFLVFTIVTVAFGPIGGIIAVVLYLDMLRRNS